MKTILFTWELGAGLGHLMRLAPLVNSLAARGFRVYAALRDLSMTAGIFDLNVVLLPAPFRSSVPPPSRIADNFADIIAEITFASDGILAAHTAAWRNLFDLIKPDVIVCDHSPTALLAARGTPARKVVIGTGFVAPPAGDVFPPLRPWNSPDIEEVGRREDILVGRANRILEKWQAKPLGRLGDLYSDVDDTFLTTFRELDPYPRPRGTRYRGGANAGGGATPDWPAGDGQRIYAYIKPFPALAELLAYLKERRLPTLIYMTSIDTELRGRFACATIRFASGRPDLGRALAECDLAILNASHASICAALLAGKPSLQLPMHTEQSLNARAVRRLGAGLDCDPKDGKMAVEKAEELLGSEGFATVARSFAERYATFDASREGGEMVERLAELAGVSSPCAA